MEENTNILMMNWNMDNSIVEPENGQTVVSTLDSNIQKHAEKSSLNLKKNMAVKEAVFLL